MTCTVLGFTRYKPLTVILGAHTVQRKEESWQIFEVQEYHCHPGFTNARKGNDILLLKVTAAWSARAAPSACRAGLGPNPGAGGDSLCHTTFTDRALISAFSVPLPS